jgi:biotin carboxyl carrier protein
VTRWVGDTVGLIEVMKSLTPVVAERGEIAVRIIRAARDWASGPCKR